MKVQHLIAEIGNCHYGDLDKAKDMIRFAKESGATLVKFQAFEAVDVAPYGSMPCEFYEQCAFTLDEYMQLIDTGNLYKIPVFFSTFSESMRKLWPYTFYHKVSAKQAVEFDFNEYSDKVSTFVSINRDYGPAPKLREAKIMFASKYLDENPNLHEISSLKYVYKRECGYSDHTRGIETCYRAVREYGARWIEKHFTLAEDKNKVFDGVLFRDSVHSATPAEFQKLAKLIR